MPGKNLVSFAVAATLLAAVSDAERNKHLCYDIPGAPDNYCIGFSAPLVEGKRLQLKALKQINNNNRLDRISLDFDSDKSTDSINVKLDDYPDYCLTYGINIKQGSPLAWNMCDSVPATHSKQFNLTEFASGRLAPIGAESFSAKAAYCNVVNDPNQADGFYCDNVDEDEYATLETDPFPWSSRYVNLFQGGPEFPMVGATSGFTDAPTSFPTVSPTKKPTSSPETPNPTQSPTLFPTSSPTKSPVIPSTEEGIPDNVVDIGTETPRSPPKELDTPAPSALDIFQIIIFVITLVLMIATTSIFGNAAYGKYVPAGKVDISFASVGMHHVLLIGGAVAIAGSVLRFHDLPVLAGEFFGSLSWVILLVNLGLFDTPLSIVVNGQFIANSNTTARRLVDDGIANVSDSFDKYVVKDGELHPKDVVLNGFVILVILFAIVVSMSFVLRLIVRSGDSRVGNKDFFIGVLNRFSFYAMFPTLVVSIYQLQLSDELHPENTAGLKALAGLLLAYCVIWTSVVAMKVLTVRAGNWEPEQDEQFDPHKTPSEFTLLATRYGSFVLSHRYGARMFWLLHIVFLVACAAVAGAVRDGSSGVRQIVILLVLHAVYALMVVLVRPFRSTRATASVFGVLVLSVLFYALFLALANDTVPGVNGPLPENELPQVSDVGHAVSIVVKVGLVSLLVFVCVRAFKIFKTNYGEHNSTTTLANDTGDESPVPQEEDNEEESENSDLKPETTTELATV